jgi:T5SS/PEP-CTERM-associated repeat protein
MSRSWATRSRSFWFALLAAISLAGSLASARAAITPIGDVEPANPSTWTSSTNGYIGNTASGTLTVNGGNDLLSGNGYIGYGSGSTGLVAVDGAGSAVTTAQFLVVGEFGQGTLKVTNHATVSSVSGQIGEFSGSTGVVTVDGTGSTWNNNSSFYSIGLIVGVSGSGTLNITNGGAVTVASATCVGDGAGSTGTINFGAHGGTLTTQSLYASPTQMAGTGTINTCGLVSDVNLVFDSTHGLSQTLTGFGSVTVKLNMSNVGNVGDLGAGWNGNGSLTIRDGIKVSSPHGFIGRNSGSVGVVTVDGTGSTWTNTAYESLSVGGDGNGTLNITGGAMVSIASTGYIGVDSGSTGLVTVDGVGSTWTSNFLISVGNSGDGTLRITNGATVSTTSNGVLGYYGGSTGLVTIDGGGSSWNSNFLSVGNGGRGTLTITGGGAVTATHVSTNSTSLLAIDVGRGSLLADNSGAGTLTNNGTIRILAGAGVPTDGVQYSPISAGAWSGTGTYQAVGGTWDGTAHTFIASSVTSGTSGTPVPLELATVQRAIVDDNGSGGTNWEVGASFVAATSTTNITFTATAMNSAILDSLRADLPANESVLSGWTFATTNYTVSSTNPIYFSFNVGPGEPSDLLEVWHYDGSAWTEYPTTDLTFDGTFASFTATGLSGYAMIAVPEPSALVLLGIGAISLLACAWRRRV